MQEENQILVRGANHLEKFGVKMNRTEPWKSTLPYLIIESQKCYSNQNIKQCIDIMRKFMIELLFSNLTPFDKKIKGKELKENILNNILLMDFIKNLPSTNSTLMEWSEEVTRYINAFFNIENTDLQLKKNKGIDYYNQNVNELFKTEIESIIPISTIHKVKGMSFDSILLVLSENGSGQNISLSDIYQPVSIPSEKQRLIYVAMSRPKKLLCIAIPNSISKEEIQQKLGDEVIYI
jgi:superfamily I DNA/RNA helicase